MSNIALVSLPWLPDTVMAYSDNDTKELYGYPVGFVWALLVTKTHLESL